MSYTYPLPKGESPLKGSNLNIQCDLSPAIDSALMDLSFDYQEPLAYKDIGDDIWFYIERLLTIDFSEVCEEATDFVLALEDNLLDLFYQKYLEYLGEECEKGNIDRDEVDALENGLVEYGFNLDDILLQPDLIKAISLTEKGLLFLRHLIYRLVEYLVSCRIILLRSGLCQSLVCQKTSLKDDRRNWVECVVMLKGIYTLNIKHY